MVYFDPQKYRIYLLKEKEKLSQRVQELKVKIGREEGPMQSWSRPAQKVMEQDLEVTLAQLDVVERKLRELTDLLEKKGSPHNVVSPGSVVTARVDGEKETFFIVAGSGDPQFGVLSIASPVGQALLGKGKGEKVQVAVSGGVREWEIFRVE